MKLFFCGKRCLIFKQYTVYLRKKHDLAWKIMIWQRATWVVCRYSLYQGKDRKWRQSGVAHCIVTDMLDGFLDQGHELIMDNWYSSPVLMKDLHERKTYAHGTLHSRRKHVPKEIKFKGTRSTFKKGESQYFTCQPVLIGCWIDKKFGVLC